MLGSDQDDKEQDDYKLKKAIHWWVGTSEQQPMSLRNF